MRALLLVVAVALGAPFQCASDPDPDRRIEDTPAEALWNLAETFREEGDEDARRRTLSHLVDRYPTSREAERARLVLSGREVSDQVSDEATTGGVASEPSDRTDGHEATQDSPAPESTTPHGSDDSADPSSRQESVTESDSPADPAHGRTLAGPSPDAAG